MAQVNKLPKVHIFQESDSDTCGPCCLAMVYSLKKKKVELANILNDFRHEKKGEATDTPQLIRHLNNNGLKTKIIISTSRVFLPSWRDLTKEELIENLKIWLTKHSKDNWHLNNLYLLFYLQEGGEAEIKSYNAETLKSMIDNGSVLILNVDETWIWGHRFKKVENTRIVDDLGGKIEGHFVVVTGYSGDKFHVLDPFPTNLDNRHGAYDIELNQLTNASLTHNPQVIEILK